MISSKLEITSKVGDLSTGLGFVKYATKTSKSIALYLDVKPSAATEVLVTLVNVYKKNATALEVNLPVAPIIKCQKKDKNESVYTDFDLAALATAVDNEFDLVSLYDTVNGTEFIIEFDSSALDGNTAQFGGSSTLSVDVTTDVTATGAVIILEEGKQIRPVTKYDN